MEMKLAPEELELMRDIARQEIGKVFNEVVSSLSEKIIDAERKRFGLEQSK